MRVLALSGIVVGTLLTSAASADAKCGTPRWLGAASGTSVPSAGTLYLHDESLAWDGPVDIDPSWLAVQWEHGEGTVHVVRGEGAIATIEYEGPPGATLKIHGGYDSADLVLAEDWQAPAKAPRVLQYWHHASRWTCSSSDSLMIQIDQPTAAVRVRWHVNGHAVDYIEATRNEETKSVLELGKINCGGENVPLEQLYDGVGIELYAIRFDGTEVRIEGMPERISLRELESVEGHMDHAMTIVATQHTAAAQAAPVARREPASKWLGIFVLAFAGFGLIAGVYLIRRVEKSDSDCSPAS